MSNIAIKPNLDGTTATLEVSGELGATEVEEFNAAVKANAGAAQTLLLDFSKLKYISSAGLRALFQAKKFMGARKGEVKVMNPSEIVMDVFKATRYDNIIKIVTDDNEGKKVLYPMRPIQLMMLNTHFQDVSTTMMNAGELVKLDNEIDTERLADAFNKVMQNNDVFATRILVNPETGDFCQRFDGEVKKVIVEHVSDETFEKIKAELKTPYEIMDHSLFNFRVFQTPTAKYLYGEFYHVAFDGVSMVMLMFREIEKYYLKPNRPPRKGASYAEYVLEEAKLTDAELAEGRQFWRDTLAGFDKKKHLPPADGGNPDDGHYEEFVHNFKNRLPANFFDGKNYTENTFYVAVAMLATANLNGVKNAVMSWVHNGRVTMKEMRMMGLMLDQFPVSWDFADSETVGDFLAGLEEKISRGMDYRKSLDVVYNDALENDCATVIFQKGNLGRRGDFTIGGKPLEFVEIPANEKTASENILDIEFNVMDDDFFLVLNYDDKVYSRAAMSRFAEKIDAILGALQDESKPIDELLKI